MASQLPHVDHPSVVLDIASTDEQRQAWTTTHPPWGHGLTLEQYVGREEYLLASPLARDGGLTQWILTDSRAATSSGAPRLILSSCETLKKRAVIADPRGVLTDVTAHGVASVFTAPAHRSRGYAGKMMALLGAELARQQESRPGAAGFSVLFSDIGPKFYAKSQWMAMGNTHIEFPVAAAAAKATTPANITEIHDSHLPALTARDEQLLRAQLAKPLEQGSAGGGGDKFRAAILPDFNTLEWQFRREDHMLRHFHGHTPTVRGALYTPPPGSNSGDASSNDEGRRAWGLWARTLYGGAEGHPVYTVLHFLRLVVENEAGTTDGELAAALEGIMAVAQREAAAVQCRTIEIWNPSARVLAAFKERLPQLQGKVVERDSYNLASLRWFGPGSVENVEWVANEKFEWC